MKIGVISDIHIDRNREYPVTEVLAAKAKEKKLDCLLLAGDISNHYTTTFRFLERFQSLSGVPLYFVPGNHDLWDQSGECRDSREIYRRYAEHPSCLIGRCIPLGGDWAVTGDTGWYDYSFANRKFTPEELERHSMYGRIWQDSLYVHWHKTDPQVHREMLARLERQLAGNREKQLIVLTHMVGIHAFLVPESREKWDYFNAFLGSREYGELYQRYNVRCGIMGHVHFRKRYVENGIMYLCSCLNYSTEWETDDIEHEIEEALEVLTFQTDSALQSE